MQSNPASFNATYFAQLASLEKRSFWFRSRNRLISWALRNHFPQAKTFFEIGCGTGFVLSGIRAVRPDLKLMGGDLYKEALSFSARRIPDAQLLILDGRQLPFHESFDVIGAFDVLEHVREDEKILREMFQCTKENGGILLTVPQHPFLWSAVDVYSFHKRRYSRRELLNKVENAGFHVVYVTSFLFFLFPVLVLSRLWQKKQSGRFDPLLEYKISPALDRILERVQDLERLLIKAGTSLLIGGSLFLIARKG